MDAGVGYIVIYGGSKPFDQIINKKCNYAVSFLKIRLLLKLNVRLMNSLEITLINFIIKKVNIF